MKYFKVTNVDDPEEEFYVSSTLPNETPIHLAMTLHLGSGDGRFDVVEVSKEEFERETEDEYEPLDHMVSDCEDDWDCEEAKDDPDCFCD